MNNNQNLNKYISDKILECFPDNIRTVPYLSELLSLSKESVYRRIKGIIPFTFDEVEKISVDMNISLDGIFKQINIGQQGNNINIEIENSLTPEYFFKQILQNYYTHLRKLSIAGEKDIILSLNRFTPVFMFSFPSLFKFIYYKWVHQMYNEKLNLKFSDIEIPSDIVELTDEMENYLYIEENLYSSISQNITFILNKDTSMDIIDEINYFYKRGLITPDELKRLKEEFFQFIENQEKWVKQLKYNYKSSLNYYVSIFKIPVNSVYLEIDNMVESQFWITSVDPFITRDASECKFHRAWINSLLKYSTLISGSNELVQAEFFNYRYSCLDKLVV